ncbi:TrlF family AAA-like ATPase [Pontibacter flavimaris]|uniref:Polymerase/histidinol phosphatase N-terminal domain-containing protein n=1 Tax=Pontibacter flavimaris TaxID=1797110 RepID=A0A1Q5P8W8_9BACT|nr:PHP domain-containing protein [Pontibacter flavimaris]OKL38685.1 hypothetical protein A3841_05975 [Pontibacter flavimaris]
MKYKGARWFKCDLHIHTTASACFQDKTVTAEQWVKEALDKGLNCVAVTDHNTGAMIDQIKLAAEGTGLTVFPGVEITCDPSKVHLLIIFDIDKTSDDINDFLITCGISRGEFGTQEAFTSLSIFEIAEKAKSAKALIIPAHIDEYNGLGSISVANLKKLYDLDYINAVQVVHPEFLSPISSPYDDELKEKLNIYYSYPNPQIDDSIIKEWSTTVKYATDANLAILSFSDNPHEQNNPKHGLWGIGSCYSWIKMDEKPSLEGLRQAFLIPERRVKTNHDCSDIPYETPELWIKSLEITNTTITDNNAPLRIDFNPQLTTIIGGRGSGKSSIFRFIRGAFNKCADICDLKEIFADQKDFYKRFDNKSKKGVLTENSEILIEFIRHKVKYQIKATDITHQESQKVEIQKFDTSSSSWVTVEEEGFIDFFEYEQYSQKQIYEIAQDPNCLRERIDKLDDDIETLKDNRETTKRLFLEKSTTIRSIQQQIAGKGKLQTEIKDLEERIKLFHESGIADLLTEKELLSTQEILINNELLKFVNIENSFDDLIDQVHLDSFNLTTFDANESIELYEINAKAQKDLESIKKEIEVLKSKVLNVKDTLLDEIKVSDWKDKYNKNLSDFNAKKADLEAQGIEDIKNFEKITSQKISKENDLNKIFALEDKLDQELKSREEIQKEFLDTTKEITKKRKVAVASILPDDKVKILIKPFRNKTDFETKLRTILQKENSFDKDINVIVEICFNGNVEKTITDIRNIFHRIRNKEEVEEVTGYFYNLVEKLNDAQIDEIDLLWPEDEIEIQYKPTNDASFRPLSTASAGQKTTAILTFILSHGNVPLLLDQPEDDLDNRLVYELIVDRLKFAKEQRQIIVVTHNANIPVNGDAEYIVSMNSESKKLGVLYSGTVDIPDIKKEICDVMEGTKHAFTMRAKRYKEIALS